MPEVVERETYQPDMMIGLMRYLPEFRGAPDEALKGYLYSLFHDSAFATPEARQQWQRNLLSQAWGTVQSVRSRNPSIFRNIPTEPAEFARTVEQQAVSYKPIPEWQKYGTLEVPKPDTPPDKMTTEEKRYMRVIDEFEQKFPGLGKELFYGGMALKNLIGKHIAPLIAATALPKLAPDWYKKWAMDRAEGLTPELDFARQVTRDYGPVAGFGYALAEAIPAIAGSVGAVGGALRILGATKIPLVSSMAARVVSNPVAFNTAFWGGYSAGAYNQSMHVQGREPTVGGYAINLAVGSAIGRMFPEPQKLISMKKGAKDFVELNLTDAMKVSVNDLRKMGQGELLNAMRAKGFSPYEMRRGLMAMRYFKQPTESLVKDYLKQSTKAGTMGFVSGAIGQLTAGLPLDFPSLVENAAFMMAFHAWGVVPGVTVPKKPRPKVEVPDGLLKVGAEGHRALIMDALEPVLRAPETEVRVWLPKFTKRLQDAGVRRVEVAEGDVRDVTSFARDYAAQTGLEAYKGALEQYARARALFKVDPQAGLQAWNNARIALDEIVAVMSRQAGQKPELTPKVENIKSAAEKTIAEVERAVPERGEKAVVEQIRGMKSVEEGLPIFAVPPKEAAPKAAPPTEKLPVKPPSFMREGVKVVYAGEQEQIAGEPVKLYNVLKKGVKPGEEILPGLVAGSTVSETTLREYGLPVPPAKPKPPIKPTPPPAPKEIKPIKAEKVEEVSQRYKGDIGAILKQLDETGKLPVEKTRQKMQDIINRFGGKKRVRKYMTASKLQAMKEAEYFFRNIKRDDLTSKLKLKYDRMRMFYREGEQRYAKLKSFKTREKREKYLASQEESRKTASAPGFREIKTEQKKRFRQREYVEPEEVERSIESLETKLAELKKEGLKKPFSEEKATWDKLVGKTGELGIAGGDEKQLNRFSAVRDEASKFFELHEKKALAEKEGKVVFERDDINGLRDRFADMKAKGSYREAAAMVKKYGQYIEAYWKAGKFKEEVTELRSYVNKEIVPWLEKHAKQPKVEGVRANVPVAERAEFKRVLDWQKIYVVYETHIVDDAPFVLETRRLAEEYKIDTAGKSKAEVEYLVSKYNQKRVESSLNGKGDIVGYISHYRGEKPAPLPGEEGRIGVITRPVFLKGGKEVAKGAEYDDIGYEIVYGREKPDIVPWYGTEQPDPLFKKNWDAVRGVLAQMGFSQAEITAKMRTAKGRSGEVRAGVDPSQLAEFLAAGTAKSKEKIRQQILTHKDFPERFYATVNAFRTWRETKDSMLTHLAQVMVYGDPKSVATPLQWSMLKSAIEYNRTNPHSLDPVKFMRATLNRSNFIPGRPDYKPLTREDARRVLSNYARISEAIRERNWVVAMNVFLPSELKRYNPRLNLFWNNSLRTESKLNALNVEGNNLMEEYLRWGLADGQRVNEMTLTPEFATFSKKAYKEADLWKKWENGRTVAEEVVGLLNRIIDRRKDKYVSDLAKRIADSMIKSGFREKWWWWFNRAVEQRLRLWSGRMYVDKDAFTRSYRKWKMEDKRTTPENSDAMYLKFTEEASDIHGDKELLKKTIDAMIASKSLGKVVDAEQRNAFYPMFYEDYVIRLLEQTEGLERGELPRERVAQFMSPHAMRRKLDRAQGLANPKFKPNPVKDFNSYMRNVSNFIWRTEIEYQSWAAKKGIMRDIAKSPQHARVFQHHIEIVNKLRGDILSYSDKFVDNLSLGLGNLAAAVFLAHPGTVARNFVGGHALTAIYNGLGWFSRGWQFRQTEEGQRVLKQMGFELQSHWGFEQHPDRGRIARELQQRPDQKFISGMNEVTRSITSYALSHPIPFLADWLPGASQLLKRFSFSGSEVHLRQVAFLAGYLRAQDVALKGPREYRHKQRITSLTMAGLAAQAKKKNLYDFNESDVRKYKTKAGQERYEYNYMGLETDKELATRARRFGMEGGMNSIIMTQFIYSRLNLPTIMQHPIGRLVLLFKRYTWNRVAFANRMIKDMAPGRGAGSEELARLLRFSIAMSGALTLSALVNINLYRWVEDDVVSMWGQVAEWLRTGEIRPYGRPVEQYLSGAFFGRAMDVLNMFEEGEVDWAQKITRLPVTPYGRMINDILVEQQKVSEGRKSIFDSIMNRLGFYLYNYDGGTRRVRRGRRSR